MMRLPLTFLCLAVFGAFAALASPGAPSDLRVDGVEAPVGVGGTPQFGWRVSQSEASPMQSAYQIRVSSELALLREDRPDVWDTRRVEGGDQSFLTFGGKPLASDHIYFWDVRTWDDSGKVGPVSEPGTFLVGPQDAGSWHGAKWIVRPSEEPDSYTLLRKGFDLPANPVHRATVYIAAAHRYVLKVNGREVGEGPAYQYPQHQYYNAYDITHELNAGRNVLAVFHRWFGGGQGRAESAPGVLVLAVVHFENGEVARIASDGTWKQARPPAWIGGQKSRNPGEGVGYIEHIDLRAEMNGWAERDFDDSAWKRVTVLGDVQTAPWINLPQPDLTRIREQEVKVARTWSVGDTQVIDFGAVHAGRPRLVFSPGPGGQEVRMLGGYGLTAEGLVDAGQNQNTDLTYLATLGEGPAVYLPAEYMGFRYLQVSGAGERLDTESSRFIARHTQLDEDASFFESSDVTLNAVWELMKRSIAVCAQEQYVDTPTREKGGFLSDGATMSMQAMPVFRERLLTRRQLTEFLHSMEQFWQSPQDRGRINAVYPNNDGGRDIPDFTQAFLPWVWTYYMETGDRDFLVRHYDKLRAVADYVERSRNPDSGLITRLPGGRGPYEFGIIDWPASMRFGYDMSAAARTVINAWAVLDNRVMARIAEAVGRPDDAQRYGGREEALVRAINARLVGPDGLYHDGLDETGALSGHASQHANMFPLALGIVPRERRDAVYQFVKAQGMRVGMVTVQHLIRAIGEQGDGQHLVDLLTNPDQPGWARSLKRGATTTWETWESDTDATSQSHGWGAAGLEAHVRYLLGIRPAAPGYAKVAIAPVDCGDRLAFVRGRIATDRGPISTEWVRTRSAYRLDVVLPPNMDGHVDLPLGAGTTGQLYVNGGAADATQVGKVWRVHVGPGRTVLEVRFGGG